MTSTNIFKSILLIFLLIYSLSLFAIIEFNAAVTTYVNNKINNIVEDVHQYGVHPDSSASVNAKNFQTALNGGNKTLNVTHPGIYEIDTVLHVYDSTSIYFSEGIKIKKITGNGTFAHVFLNEGAPTRTKNYDIHINGLEVIQNGIAAIHTNNDDPLYGLRGEVAFFNIQDASITGFRINDLGPGVWAIGVTSFERVRIEGFFIDGSTTAKDGIHIGYGNDLIIRNGIIKTYDDGIALNAIDYPSAQPIYGDITNVLIENVTDSSRNVTANFIRILPGAISTWYPEMLVRHGDVIVHNGNQYSIVGSRSELVSATAPTHAIGEEIIDNIHFIWKGISTDTVFNVQATVRNCFLYSERHGILGHGANPSDVNMRSAYINRVLPMPDIIIENIHDYATGIHNIIYDQIGMRVTASNIKPNRSLIRISGYDGFGTTGKYNFTHLDYTNSNLPSTDIKIKSDSIKIDLALNSFIQTRDINISIPATLPSLQISGDASFNKVINNIPIYDDILVNNISGQSKGKIGIEIVNNNFQNFNHDYRITFDDSLISTTNYLATSKFSLVNITINDTIARRDILNQMVSYHLIDGLGITIVNDSNGVLKLNSETSGWNNPDVPEISFIPFRDSINQVFPEIGNYQIIFSELGVDTSVSFIYGTNELESLPVNFTIVNTITNEKVKFAFLDNYEEGLNGIFQFHPTRNDITDEIILFNKTESSVASWWITFSSIDKTDKSQPEPGDIQTINLSKPFLSEDIFEFNPSIIEGNVYDRNESNIPSQFRLYQNYPNPFNPNTTIMYDIAVPEKVSIKIYNIIGQLVAKLLNDQQTAGTYKIKWNSSNLSSGIYFYRIEAGDFTDVKRMLLIK